MLILKTLLFLKYELFKREFKLASDGFKHNNKIMKKLDLPEQYNQVDRI